MRDEIIGRYNALKKRSEIIKDQVSSATFSIEMCFERLVDKENYKDIENVDEYKAALATIRNLKGFIQEL